MDSGSRRVPRNLITGPKSKIKMGEEKKSFFLVALKFFHHNLLIIIVHYFYIFV
jgi:hypothetical protein